MRPLLFDVDAGPPASMTILFPGRPNRFITIRIRTPSGSLKEASRAAVGELDGFTPVQLELLEESAAVANWDSTRGGIPITGAIEPVGQEQRYTGPLYCPACCHKLGRGDSPSIAYLERCAVCGRGLSIRFAPGLVTVVLRAEP